MGADKKLRDWLSQLSEEEFLAFLGMSQRELQKRFPRSDEEIDAIDESKLPEIPPSLRDPQRVLKARIPRPPQECAPEAEYEFAEAVGLRSDEPVPEETEEEIKKKLNEMLDDEAGDKS